MNGGQEKDVVEEKEVGKEEAKEKAKEKPPKEKAKEKEDRGRHHGHKVHGVPRARTLPTNLKRYVLFTSMEIVGMEAIAI